MSIEPCCVECAAQPFHGAVKAGLDRAEWHAERERIQAESAGQLLSPAASGGDEDRISRAIAENPHLNSFRKGGKLVLLDEVTISALVEREFSGERVPEPFGIVGAQAKSYRAIHNEIRAAQQHARDGLGGLSGMRWVRFIPAFLLRAFIRIASKSIPMQKRFGVIGVTAVGMFANEAIWFVPLSAATVTVTVGGIVKRPSTEADSSSEREHLCLTVTFNHDIVDGAPAARFLKRFSELLMDTALLDDEQIKDMGVTPSEQR